MSVDSGPGRAVLDAHRLLVLRVGRTMVWGLLTPFMLLILLRARLAGDVTLFLALQTLVSLGMALALVFYKGSLEASARVMTAGAGLVFALGLFHFGPLFGVGLQFIVWVLMVVLFHRKVVAPAILASSTVLALGAIRQFGLVTFSWPDINGGFLAWVRVALTTGAMTWAAGFLFHELISRLVETVGHQAESRKRELSALADRDAAVRSASERQHLGSLGRLAGGAAHDFNNSLTVIVGGLDALSERSLANDAREILDEMSLAVQGAMSTTSQLLSFSRQATSPEPSTVPHESLDPLARSLRRLLPANIEIRRSLTPCPAVDLPSGEFQRSILNLCLNARDAMADGGGVLTLACEPSADGRFVSIEISDTGTGMDEETRRRVLEPFFTTKVDGRGTGLGLSIVQGVIAKAGGELALDSRPGHGTTVTLSIPTSDRVPNLAEVSVAPTSPSGAGVLLVEDDAVVRRVVRRILTTAGYEVETAGSQTRAMQRCAERDFDGLITDGMVEDGEPAALIRLFQRRGRPVVVVSGYLRDQLGLDGVDDDRIVFLPKPVRGRDLLDVIQRELAAATPSVRATERYGSENHSVSH